MEFRVIVHASNPVDALPQDDVAKMFRRQEKAWKEWDGGPRVEPVDQKWSAPVRVSFTQRVHGSSPREIRTYWHRQIFSAREAPPLQRDTDEEVIDFVASTPGGIGYVTADTKLPATVKELRIEE